MKNFKTFSKYETIEAIDIPRKRKFSKNSDFSGQWGHFEGPQLFLLDIARSKIFTRSRATQKLHFKPINSLAGAGAKYLQPKYFLKHKKQRHLVVKIKSRIFFVEALGPLNNSTTVFGRCYYLVKSPFFRHFQPYV